MFLHKKGFLAFWGISFGLLSLAAGGVTPAQAGVFNIPHFVEPGNFALGLEPELFLSPSAGLGINAKYTQGLNDLMNFQGILGTGGGPRRFRVGGNLTWDFVPDVEGQPGIGLATQALYYRIPDAGRLELTGIPYIHKNFPQAEGEGIDPYFAFPIGFAFTDGEYQTISTAVVGVLWKKSEHLSYSTEMGININHAATYFSGGIIFYH
jgi:hypothetical protein